MAHLCFSVLRQCTMQNQFKNLNLSYWPKTTTPLVYYVLASSRDKTNIKQAMQIFIFL